ncbi:MAG: response regulator [Rhodocyclaceae bacterium]|nr:response regulator [Rhodocyclaceae bacterium]
MRLLLVEDNQELSRWLCAALQQSGYAVDCAADGMVADGLLAYCKYDVVVLDRGLPRMEGLTVLQRLRARGDRVPVLVLSARGEIADRVSGIDKGADDYLVKPFAIEELEARLRGLVRRAHGMESPVLRLGPLSMDSVGRAFQLDGRLLSFTPREHAVLEALMLRAGKPISKQVLYEKIFDYDAQANTEAVEIYVSRVRKKLDHPDLHIVTLRGLGYLLELRRNGV